MKSLQASTYPIHFEEFGYKSLQSYIANTSYSSIFILVDEHTKSLCYPVFCDQLPELKQAILIEIPAGEAHKNIATCIEVWNTLTDLGVDRSTLLITLGGGVITDLGGFVAATFKRGIDFINIPTTLLSMVDASVGGKTGIDLGVLKNQIGLFANPKMVVVDTAYLETLPPRELRSGLAEVIKYGMTFNHQLIDEVNVHNKRISIQLVHDSIAIKNTVVAQDPKESGVRKVLNFGHTLGHAIESYFLENDAKETLTHGEAIAVGMICETFLSVALFDYPKTYLNNLVTTVCSIFGKISLVKQDYAQILENLKHDKKNKAGRVLFVLLQGKEDYVLNVNVSETLIIESLDFYSGLTEGTANEA